ncbi:MAG: peptidoglycan recognition family protein [Pseudomonadota bacterium]
MPSRRSPLLLALVAASLLASSLGQGCAHGASPPAVEQEAPPEPAVEADPCAFHERLIPYGDERCRLTMEYLAQHHPGMAAGTVPASCTLDPRMIVLHWTGGDSLDSAWNTFAPLRLAGRPDLQAAGAVNVSAHFLVDRDGSIQQLVPENRVARHVIGLNHVAIGVENVGGTAPAPLTDAQVEADIALVRCLAARHPITHLIGHHEYRQMERHPYFQEADPTYRTAKADPGPEFMARVRAGVGDLGLRGAEP